MSEIEVSQVAWPIFGAVIGFAVSWGGIKAALSQSKEDRGEMKTELKRLDAEMRHLIFDDGSMPRFVPIFMCDKKHDEFTQALAKLESKIDNRDQAITDALGAILIEVRK